jgi:ribonuclease HII
MSKKLTKKQREELIERIMREFENNYEHYQEYILSCVKDTIENWEDDELINWIGEQDEKEN